MKASRERRVENGVGMQFWYFFFLCRCVMSGVDAVSDVYFTVADSCSVLHLADA